MLNPPAIPMTRNWPTAGALVAGAAAAIGASACCAGAALAADVRTVTLDVRNMDCAVCPITVRKALERVPGVEAAKVDFRSKQTLVAFDPARTTAQALTQATTEAGYPSSVRPEATR